MKARLTIFVARKTLVNVAKDIKKTACGPLVAALLVLLLVVGVALPGRASVSAAEGTYSPMTMLVSPYQLAVEDAAARLLQYPAVVQAKQQAMDYLSDTSLAADPANLADLPAYVDGLAHYLAMYVALSNQTETQSFWCVFPSAQYGLDNPDNTYTGWVVNESSSYVITGKRNTSNGLFFQLFDVLWGDGRMAQELGYLDDDQLITAPDGSFTITLDATPGTPGTNHIQLKPGSQILSVRDTLSDWASEMPADLHIERTAGPDVTPLTEEEQAAEVARLLGTTSVFLSAIMQIMLARLPSSNWLPLPSPPAGGLPTQLASMGYIDLADDQALVVTIDPAGAGYLGFSLCSYWFVAMNYWDYTSSLNNSQVVANADGTITYVLSAQDPGVWNWIDTVGHGVGLIYVRWQNVPVGVTPPMPTCQVVPLSMLNSVLPPDMAMADQNDRENQLQERRLSLERRIPHYALSSQVETATSTGSVHFSVAKGIIENLVAVPESSLPPEGKPEIQFPYGLFEFQIIGLTPGQSVTVTITIPSAVPTTASYCQYGPTSNAPLGEWYQIPMGDNNGDNIITITLTDGGYGDDDLTANGSIVVQGGPGWPQAATTLSLANASGSYGSTVDLSATLTSGGTGVSTKDITFTINGTVAGSTATNSSGVATLSNISIAGIGAGEHTGYIEASFAGDTNYLGSSGTADLTVSQASTTTSVSSSANPSRHGHSVTLTAIVTGTGATGTVIFKDGSTTIGSSTLSNGTATYSTSTLSAGSHSITAVYGGDTNFAGSTSSPLTQKVNAAPGANWGVIGGSIAAVLVIGLVISLWVVRRRHT